ncbi:MAG: putative NTE family protein [Anaerolineae bacterium]|nr:putative NTE family protein [Anaerolineae bacterium]
MSTILSNNNMVVDSLQHIPFFRGLSPTTLAKISAKLHQVTLEHGHIVFTEGDLGDSLYLIESGQVKVSVLTDGGTHEKIINYLGPGNFFGEMALILDQRRSATITVTIDADLWVLHKADLDELLADNPEIALQITKELSRRLSDAVSEASRRPGFRLSAVFGPDAGRLAESVFRQTQQRVVLYDATGQGLVDEISVANQHESLVILTAESNGSSETFVETLGILADGFDWVLVVLPTQYDEISVKAVQLAQAAVLCNVPRYDWIAKFCSGPVFECDSSQVSIDRAARKITHRVVGLALSSGGARGIAHIGVLETLEKEGIPIDMLAGTSAGSLFGGLYAVGKTPAEIAQFARNLIKQIDFKSGLWDPKFSRPWNGLIKGKATVKYLARHFNDATFADTRMPFYVVAADVLTGEEVVFDTGSLADAVRASIGMIGIFSPYQIGDHYLIDGGAVNPVPASVLAERGANIIIASSVIPSLEEERARGQVAAQRQRQPNFLGVLSNMMSIMEREIVKTRMAPVDVLIKPTVEIFTAMDYDNADDFLELGRDAARQNLSHLKKLFVN